MDFHLDRLLNLPDVTVESCTQEAPEVFLKLCFLKEESNCPHCHQPSEKLHQNRPVLIRDLPISGQRVFLQVPRRQFYCGICQKYFTERLSFVDWERRYTQRYENYIYQRVQATTIEQVSREEELSWDQVQGIFNYRFNQAKKWIGNQLNV
jgi:transposase